MEVNFSDELSPADRLLLEEGAIRRVQDDDLPQCELRSVNIHHHPWMIYKKIGASRWIAIRHSVTPQNEQRFRASPGEYVGPHLPHRHDPGEYPDCCIDLEGFFGSHLLLISERDLHELSKFECAEEDWAQVARIQDWSSNRAHRHPEPYSPRVESRS